MIAQSESGGAQPRARFALPRLSEAARAPRRQWSMDGARRRAVINVAKSPSRRRNTHALAGARRPGRRRIIELYWHNSACEQRRACSVSSCWTHYITTPRASALCDGCLCSLEADWSRWQEDTVKLPLYEREYSCVEIVFSVAALDYPGWGTRVAAVAYGAGCDPLVVWI